MTDEEWLESADPGAMLQAVRRLWNPRRCGLLGVACCRRAWGVIESSNQRVVEALEQKLEGQIDDAAWAAVMSGLVTEDDVMYRGGTYLERVAAGAVESVARGDCVSTLSDLSGAVAYARLQTDEEDAVWREIERAEAAAQAGLVRDVFGLPQRPLPFHPAWRSAEVMAIARAIYADQDFARMPSLADALARTGCANPHVLGHCRGDGPHVRGCWAVDLLLGKD